jgi:hypothetical protein
MLPQKFLEDVGIGMFTAKTAIGDVNPMLSPLASLFSAPWAIKSGPGCHLGAFKS